MSSVLMASASRRSVSNAASLSTLASSAGLSPGRSRATWSRSTSGAMGCLRACTRSTSPRPTVSGLSTLTLRSKRPARMRAGSSRSARLVAATKTTPMSGVKPSISVSSWFSVCSRSSLVFMPASARLIPSASISSTKMMHGALTRARLKRSRTRAAPTPTMISTNSEPLIWKNGTPLSPAIALAMRVLPVPGPPSSSTPLGGLAFSAA
mmetsp:Transcript_16982/g.42622  ORF Transcript_16982/g.42622 Transcript_16982/m.42622 type:complete len:209 (-) Transcript_16982:1308-1934(-)